MQTVQELYVNMVKVGMEKSSRVNPTDLAAWWLSDLFRVYDNIQTTSLNEKDKKARMFQLAETISKDI